LKAVVAPLILVPQPGQLIIVFRTEDSAFNMPIIKQANLILPSDIEVPGTTSTSS